MKCQLVSEREDQAKDVNPGITDTEMDFKPRDQRRSQWSERT